MVDDSEKKVGDLSEENVPADLDKAFETTDDDPVTPGAEAGETPTVPVEEPGSDASPLVTPDVPAAPKPFQDVSAPADAAKPQAVSVEVSNSFSEPKDAKDKSTAQASNVPVFPNADMGAGTVNVFPKKTSSVPAVLATIFAILFVLALAALAWVLYVNDWNYLPKKADSTTSQTTTTSDASDKSGAGTTKNTSATNTLKVAELGVQLTNLPSSIADMTYTAKTNADGSVDATLTTPEIKTAVAADSHADADSCAVGVLTKESGTYKSGGATLASQTFVAQYNGFYLIFTAEQSDCSSNASTQAIVTSAQNAFADYLKTPSNIVAL